MDFLFDLMKSRIFFFLGVISLLILSVDTANAQMPPCLTSECDFCMCSQGISPLEMGGSAIRYDVRYTELSREYSNGARVANSTNMFESYFTNQLSFIYHIADAVTASLIVPYAHKNESFVNPINSPFAISNTGPVDISLLARYNLIAEHSFGNTRIFSLTGGVKFANGSTSLTDQGQPADPDVQLGTGTTDFFAGAGYLLGFENWSLGADLLGGIRGFGGGASGHVYGDNLNYDVTARYRIYQTEVNRPSIFSPTVFAALGIRGEWRGYELQDGVRIDNSGGDVTYIAPGIQIFFTPTISLDATVWVPFIHALNGDQLGETVKILSGAQIVF